MRNYIFRQCLVFDLTSAKISEWHSNHPYNLRTGVSQIFHSIFWPNTNSLVRWAQPYYLWNQSSTRPRYKTSDIHPTFRVQPVKSELWDYYFRRPIDWNKNPNSALGIIKINEKIYFPPFFSSIWPRLKFQADTPTIDTTFERNSGITVSDGP